MDNSPHKHVKRIVDFYIQSEEKSAVLAYIDHMKARVEELERKYENTGAIFSRQAMQSKIDDLEKELRKVNNARRY